jgi:hypothetical protein
MTPKIYPLIATLLTLAALAGCGGPPLAQPEATPRSPVATPPPEKIDVAVAQVTATPVATPTILTATWAMSPTMMTSYPPLTVEVISDGPMLSPDILSLMGVEEHNPVWVEEWLSVDKIVVGVGYNNPTFWLVSKDANISFDSATKGHVQVEPFVRSLSDEIQTEAVNELRQFDERIKYVTISPDEQWGAWGSGETLLVKRLGTNESPINLLGVKYDTNDGTMAWSPDSKQLAYVVYHGELSQYEIRISNLQSQEAHVTQPLGESSPFHLAWSPNGQYIAFKMLEEPQSGIDHIYLIRQDGSGLTQVTQHGYAEGPIRWPPTGEAITYKHGIGDGSRAWVVVVDIQE